MRSLYHWPHWAQWQPDAPALLFEHSPAAGLPLGRLSWRQLAAEVDVLARELQCEGFSPGDRLVHTCGNSRSGVLMALASLAIGTIEVPLDPSMDEAPRQVLADCVGGRWYNVTGRSADCRAGDASRPARFGDAAPASLWERHARRGGDEASLILFTSGTGGQSKAVTLSRRNLATNAAAKLQAVPQSVQDVRVCLLPIWHAYARTCDLATWLLSGSALAITSGWAGWKRVAPILRPTMVNMVPSVAMRLLSELPDCSPSPASATDGSPIRALAQRPELSRLRILGCGGAALPTEAFTRFARHRITVIQGYGLTEASPVICSATPHNARPGLVGCPVRGWHTRIDDDGRLWVRGDGVMLGYWDDPQETQRRVIDGWLDTGDLVQVDSQDSQFRILGRCDDRITLPNARKVHPAPIEQRILGLSGVLHALLVPVDRHLELWLDVQPDLRARDDWQARADALLADLPRWQRPRRVIVLPRPLAEIPTALTRKGTLVRSEVIAFFQREPKVVGALRVP